MHIPGSIRPGISYGKNTLTSRPLRKSADILKLTSLHTGFLTE